MLAVLVVAGYVRSLRKKGVSSMRWLFLALVLCVGCGGLTEPESRLEAWFSVEPVELGVERVTFTATAADSIWWKVDWMDRNMLLDFGQGAERVDAAVAFNVGFQFWLEFTAWTPTDTVVVTFMRDGPRDHIARPPAYPRKDQ